MILKITNNGTAMTFANTGITAAANAVIYLSLNDGAQLIVDSNQEITAVNLAGVQLTAGGTGETGIAFANYGPLTKAGTLANFL